MHNSPSQLDQSFSLRGRQRGSTSLGLLGGGLLLLFSLQPIGAAVRLKELASLEGVRDNQLMGYGLVVGLNGTGDKRQTVFSAQALTNVLRRMGVTVSPTAIQVRNMAAVMVTATLPPFAQPGTRIDINAAAIGDATNLQGGMLLLTSLQGPDGQIYAAAQGPLLTSGFVAGGSGNSKTVNHPTVARIPEGAIVEKTPPSVAPTNKLRLQLRQADFTTAARMVEALNKRFPAESKPTASIPGNADVPANTATGNSTVLSPVAHAENSGLVTVEVPASWATRTVEFIAEVESITVDADRVQKIVINERTGTIVLGKDVRITPVAIMQGSLSIEIQTVYDVSQPNSFSTGATGILGISPLTAAQAGPAAVPPPLQGVVPLAVAPNGTAVPGGAQTAITPRVDVKANESKAQNIILKQGATVEDLVRSLQAIGSTSRDIIAVLQSMKAAGALAAEIDVI
ncbi:MAG: flagellar basal body P-ring protein FlgI [Acidobacteriota bacterium]